MRYARILLLNFQQVLEERLGVFVWFLLSLFSPLLMILFWKGAKISSGSQNFSTIASYYLLLIVGGSFLMSHAEESIATFDIQEGRLSSYLLKPYSYFILKFLGEFPWRALQGTFGFVALIIFVIAFHLPIHTVGFGASMIITVFIVAGSLFLSHLYKMNLGFIAFWVTDAFGVFQVSEMLLFLFAGYIVPLALYPTPMAHITYILPFSYMIYFPVAAIEGVFSLQQLYLIFAGQLLWIGLFSGTYVVLWRKGVRLFTGVGQ